MSASIAQARGYTVLTVQSCRRGLPLVPTDATMEVGFKPETINPGFGNPTWLNKLFVLFSKPI